MQRLCESCFGNLPGKKQTFVRNPFPPIQEHEAFTAIAPMLHVCLPPYHCCHTSACVHEGRLIFDPRFSPNRCGALNLEGRRPAVPNKNGPQRCVLLGHDRTYSVEGASYSSWNTTPPWYNGAQAMEQRAPPAMGHFRSIVAWLPIPVPMMMHSSMHACLPVNRAW